MEVRSLDMTTRSPNSFTYGRLIVFELHIERPLVSGILSGSLRCQGAVLDAPPHHDGTGRPGRGTPEYAFRVESDGSRLAALSREQSARVLRDGARREGR